MERLDLKRRSWSPAEAERWLRAREPLGMHFGLDRMGLLLNELGNPQRRFRTIHVVGTNGKSSTVRMTAAILEAHAHLTGSYLSPHLTSFAERVEIGERPLEAHAFAAMVARVAAATARVDADRHPDDHVTQFEALTAMAYTAFAQQGVDVAVVEAGLGGRLDATNVTDSEVQVLTSIGLDHTSLLGDTEAEIAAEKLAVVRDGATLVLGPGLGADVERLAVAAALSHGAAVLRAATEPTAAPAVLGAFQRRNFAVAETAAAALMGPLDDAAVQRAATAVRTPGRLEVIARAPLTLVDAAHNPAGIAALVDALGELDSQVSGSARVAVISVLADKDAESMLRAVSTWATIIVVTSNSSPRARDSGELSLLARAIGGPPVITESDPQQALKIARTIAADGIVLATGSICLVGDLVAPEPGFGRP
jgi:dihydrofolate synthase/folylpolyglutamate synthase